MEYSGQSSGALESFSNQINGMIKKTQSFIHLMEKYASPKGMDRLLAEAENFKDGAIKDIEKVVDHYIKKATKQLKSTVSDVALAGVSSETTHMTAEPDLALELSGAFNFVT